MRDADTSKVKGYAYLSYVEPLRARPATWEAIRASLPPGDRAFFDGDLISNHWYPRAHLHGLLDSVEGAATSRVTAELRDLGAAAARHQIGAIYRAFLAFASPALVFRRAESVWSRQSTGGAFRVVEDGEQRLVGELDDASAPRQIPTVMAGWSDEVIRLLRRAPNPTRVTTPAPGRWRFEVSWRDR